MCVHGQGFYAIKRSYACAQAYRNTQHFTHCRLVCTLVQVWSPSGKRRPPPGRWVSTGKEALKSGLNIPGVAESYDEGGNLTNARWARGLKEGEQLPPSSSSW